VCSPWLLHGLWLRQLWGQARIWASHFISCAWLHPCPARTLPLQVSLWGDLSYLLQPAYAAEMRRQLAAAEPWEGQVGAGRRTAAKPRPGAVYAVYYTFEQYTRLAARMKLWPFPRAHFQHVASIPWM
jgi:hypothetical protein